MNTGITYRIRQADFSDLPACLDLWAKKEHTLAARSTRQRLIDHGREVISRWIEEGVMHLVVTETGDVVACLSPAGDASGLRTPAEVALMSELQRGGRCDTHGDGGLLRPERRSAGLGPLARTFREIAETKDDLAAARGLSADDDTFAVEADMLERRLHVLETRLREMQAAIDPDDMAGEAAVWTEAATMLTQMKLDVAPTAANPWNAALSHAASVLGDRARAAREASDAAAGARAGTTN